MPTATTKPTTVSFWKLTTPEEMGTALSKVLAFGYRGAIQAFKDDKGTDVWRLELNGPGNPVPVVAGLGDVLIKDGASLTTMSQQAFTDKYTVP